MKNAQGKLKRYLPIALVIALVCIFYLSPLAGAILLSLWVAASLSAVALAYHKNWAGIFRKSANGSIPTAIRWVFLPFFIGIGVYNFIKRRLDDSPLVQQIDDDLYIGSRLFESDIAKLQEHGIAAILDLTAEFDGLGIAAEEDEPFEYLNIPVLDHMVPKDTQIEQACRWIKTQHDNNKPVVVHCALGRGRSFFIIAAYMALKQQNIDNPDSIFEAVQKIRKKANLKKRQEQGLKRWLQEHGAQIIKRKKAAIIANPVSGGGKWQDYKQEILDTLSNHYKLDLFETTEERGAKEIAQEIDCSAYSLVIACGGDGTLNEVAHVLTGTNCHLAVIPLGTANSFAHAVFGVETKLLPIEKACHNIIHGKPHKIDLARCNDRTMILALGIGLEEYMVSAANRDRKTQLGPLAYIEGFVEAVTKGTPIKLNLKFDDEDAFDLTTQSLVIANAAPSTTILAQGNKEPNCRDGKLDVTWFENTDSITSRISAIGSLALKIYDEEAEHAGVKHRQIERLSIGADSTINYVLDGEPHSAERLEIEVIPAAVNLLLADE